MDDYPDEDEEYDIRYQDELELLNEIEDNQCENLVPVTHNRESTKTSVINVISKDVSLSSPQLSQISFAQDSQVTRNGGPAHRRLFGTPIGPQRGTSTPLPKHGLVPIQEVVSLVSDQHDLNEHVDGHINIFEEMQGVGLRSKRRLERDLFGDIDDLYQCDTYHDPAAKKARTEEERDLQTIEKILELRRQSRETTKSVRKDVVSRLQAVLEHKAQNLARQLPQWPSAEISLCGCRRIYVRFHTEEYEKHAINLVNSVSHGSLLGSNKTQIWNDANNIILRRTASDSDPIAVEVVQENLENTETGRLWVEKYKPTKYIDLLSDEKTNRSLLSWLKMWDKVVFGRESKIKPQSEDAKKFRFGRFLPKSSWKNKSGVLDTNFDAHGRPMHKIALLCGPPGLGKTTLAHTIARHAGYEVREINASDDRSPEAFKLALENGTQMRSVISGTGRPNCIVLDEIDGAPRQSIEFLIKFVNTVPQNKTQSKSGKQQHSILKRPIICICNDLYSPALRLLRQNAFVVTFPPIDSARLAERLQQIANNEGLKTNFGSLILLAEKSGNDVRSCISTMEFFNTQKKEITLFDVLNSNIGQKDRHQGLFESWNTIFRIPRPVKQREESEADDNERPLVTVTHMSVDKRVQHVLTALHTGGEYDRLTQGVFENYLHQKMPDPNLNGVVQATQWFCFTDIINHQISHTQNYTLYPYLQYGFAVWHLLFATLAWPKIHFPIKGFEHIQKSTAQSNIFNAFRKGLKPYAIGIGRSHVILTESVPILKRILSPNLRSLTLQLMSPKEQQDLRHTTEVMLDLGLTYIQVRGEDGAYLFQMEPNLDALVQFPGSVGITVSYIKRQFLAREMELMIIRHSAPKQADDTPTNDSKKLKSKNKSNSPSASLPNYLRKLKPKEIDKNENSDKDPLFKDFFGRIQRQPVVSKNAQKGEGSKMDVIVKSPIWYRFKEGFNNAVRKDMQIKQLL